MAWTDGDWKIFAAGMAIGSRYNKVETTRTIYTGSIDGQVWASTEDIFLESGLVMVDIYCVGEEVEI